MAEVFVGPVAQGYASGEVTVLLASPRSFCAGVERAIETVKRVLDVAEGPVYVRKQIVHNTVVVAELRDRGAVFVEDLDEIPDPPPPGAVVVFSAHGVSPAVRAGLMSGDCRSSTRPAHWWRKSTLKPHGLPRAVTRWSSSGTPDMRRPKARLASLRGQHYWCRHPLMWQR